MTLRVCRWMGKVAGGVERTRHEHVGRIERSEIRERSRRPDADPGFHFVQSGLRLLYSAETVVDRSYVVFHDHVAARGGIGFFLLLRSVVENLVYRPNEPATDARLVCKR